jgi:metaxin
MSYLTADLHTLQLAGRTPWPDNVRLFQPYEVGQILMPEFASCLSVKTFLNMCGLKFQTELKANAEFMSPSGKIPFLEIGSLLVSELEPVVAIAAAKGYSLNQHLTDEQRADMKAYMMMIHNVFVTSQLYILWYDKETREMVTNPRYGSYYKWPLNKLLPLRKYYEVAQLLHSKGWANKSKDEVYDEISLCCQSLSEKLGNQQFFFGSKPTELDALIFGHLFTALTTTLPSDRLAEAVRNCANLTDFCRRIHDAYFSDSHNDAV